MYLKMIRERTTNMEKCVFVHVYQKAAHVLGKSESFD